MKVLLLILTLVISTAAESPKPTNRLDLFESELNSLMNKYPEVYEGNVEVLWYDSDDADGWIYTWTWESE